MRPCVSGKVTGSFPLRSDYMRTNIVSMEISSDANKLDGKFVFFSPKFATAIMYRSQTGLPFEKQLPEKSELERIYSVVYINLFYSNSFTYFKRDKFF